MQPATIRRLLVFGVCLAGVGGLYLCRAPPAPRPPASRRPAGTCPPPGRASPPSSPSPHRSWRERPDRSRRARPRGPAATTLPGRGRPTGVAARWRPLADPGRDKNPPAAVGRLSVTRVDAERLTVTWPAADDDVGVVGYQVWLNGFFVLSTQQPRASLPVVQRLQHPRRAGPGPGRGRQRGRVEPDPAGRPAQPESRSRPPRRRRRPPREPSSPRRSTTADGGNEIPDTTNTPAPTSGPHRSSDAEKEESS